jgi:hypothetical protein
MVSACCKGNLNLKVTKFWCDLTWSSGSLIWYEFPSNASSRLVVTLKMRVSELGNWSYICDRSPSAETIVRPYLSLLALELTRHTYVRAVFIQISKLLPCSYIHARFDVVSQQIPSNEKRKGIFLTRQQPTFAARKAATGIFNLFMVYFTTPSVTQFCVQW